MEIGAGEPNRTMGRSEIDSDISDNNMVCRGLNGDRVAKVEEDVLTSAVATGCADAEKQNVLCEDKGAALTNRGAAVIAKVRPTALRAGK